MLNVSKQISNVLNNLVSADFDFEKLIGCQVISVKEQWSWFYILLFH